MNTKVTAKELRGRHLPNIQLTAADEMHVNLSTVSGLSVVYAYPRTSPPNEPPICGWDQIPGARCCTPQSKRYAEHHGAIISAGAERIFGMSTQSPEYQKEVVERLSLPFHILSDATLELATALGLPTFEAGGMVLLRRMTLIIEDGKITEVFYPVPEPAQNAAEILTHLNG